MSVTKPSGKTSTGTPHGLPLGPIVKDVIKLAYRARRPVLLEGPTGIGKSEIIRQVAEELKIHFSVLDLSLLEPPDLVGLPVITNGRTTYAAPVTLPLDGAGILLLEELNRAERYIQQPALQLLTARRLHDYILPDGWSACAAINPEKEDYQVTPLDPALRSRFMNLVVRADRESWLKWANAGDIHPAVLSIAEAHERFLEDTPPRTWVYVSQLLQAAEPGDLSNEKLLRASLGGYLNHAWIDPLLEALQNCELADGIELRQLLGNYHTNHTLQQKLADLRTQGRTDVLDQIAHRLLRVLDGPELQTHIQSGNAHLDSIDRLFDDIVPDSRETLQRALATNPFAVGLLKLQRDDVFLNYSSKGHHIHFQAWCKEPKRKHRAELFVRFVCLHLEKEADKSALRKHAGILTSLEQIRKHTEGTPWQSMLHEAYQRHDIHPPKQGKR